MMETVIYLLMGCIVMNCAAKLSLWRWWQQWAFAAVLGGFVWWAVGVAEVQSKTEVDGWLRDGRVLQNMAMVVTLESVMCLLFVVAWLNGGRRRWYHRVLEAYPSLLVFPVMLYLLMQLLFNGAGWSFRMVGGLCAAGVLVALPLLAGGLRWLIPQAEGRVELHLLLSLFVCILGLLATQTSRMVYAVAPHPVAWGQLALTLGGFLLVAMVGYVLARYKKYR